MQSGRGEGGGHEIFKIRHVTVIIKERRLSKPNCPQATLANDDKDIEDTKGSEKKRERMSESERETIAQTALRQTGCRQAGRRRGWGGRGYY